MKLQEIRDQLIQNLENDISNWDDVINNTNPGNYGVEDWDVSVPEKDFFVDIPSKTFKFKNVDFSAKLLLGGSNEESGFVQEYSKPAKGNGVFEFVENNRKVIITDINIEIDSDVFG